eukprot:Hpha_TRINITY_DN15983_c1_g1::TRINITY_DN15983_c1_g1_i1::g.70455::m.70455
MRVVQQAAPSKRGGSRRSAQELVCFRYSRGSAASGARSGPKESHEPASVAFRNLPQGTTMEEVVELASPHAEVLLVRVYSTDDGCLAANALLARDEDVPLVVRACNGKTLHPGGGTARQVVVHAKRLVPGNPRIEYNATSLFFMRLPDSVQQADLLAALRRYGVVLRVTVLCGGRAKAMMADAVEAGNARRGLSGKAFPRSASGAPIFVTHTKKISQETAAAVEERVPKAGAVVPPRPVPPPEPPRCWVDAVRTGTVTRGAAESAPSGRSAATFSPVHSGMNTAISSTPRDAASSAPEPPHTPAPAPRDISWADDTSGLDDFSSPDGEEGTSGRHFDPHEDMSRQDDGMSRSSAPPQAAEALGAAFPADNVAAFVSALSDIADRVGAAQRRTADILGTGTEVVVTEDGPLRGVTARVVGMVGTGMAQVRGHFGPDVVLPVGSLVPLQHQLYPRGGAPVAGPDAGYWGAAYPAPTVYSNQGWYSADYSEHTGWGDHTGCPWGLHSDGQEITG